jgi:prefoldin subunit 5
MSTLEQRYNQIKTEYESVQKTLTELEAKQADLQNSLMRLNLCIQLEDHHLVRPIPVGGFLAYWRQS